MEGFKLDEEAQNRLLHRLYYDEVGPYLTVMRLPKADMEDILQDTIVTAWTRLDTLEDISKAGSWAREIAKNKARKYFKQRSKYWKKHYFYGDYDWGLSAEDDEGVSEAGFALEEALVFKEMKCFKDSDLYEMVEELGEPASIILSLHYGYQETYEEIAGTLHLKPGTVRSIASRSRAKLKKRIEEEGGRHAYGRRIREDD